MDRDYAGTHNKRPLAAGAASGLFVYSVGAWWSNGLPMVGSHFLITCS